MIDALKQVIVLLCAKRKKTKCYNICDNLKILDYFEKKKDTIFENEKKQRSRSTIIFAGNFCLHFGSRYRAFFQKRSRKHTCILFCFYCKKIIP